MLPICNDFSSFSSFPSELKALDQWVIHRKKIPYDAKTVRNASVSDSTTWSSFEKALKVCTENHYDGLGFVFTDGQDYVGIDIDTCRDPATNRISDGAKNLIDLFDSYTEISPSGYGVHIIIRTDAGFTLPRNRFKMKANGIIRTDPTTNKPKNPELEIYNHSRYFTVTGNVYGTLKPIAERTKALQEFLAKYAETEKCPQQITLSDKPYTLSNEDVIEKASRSDKSFMPLYNGNNLHYTSDSEADLEFCNKLVFWTDGKAEQIDQIFRNSQRMRDKWDRKVSDNTTYGQATIQKALNDATGYYDPDYLKRANKSEHKAEINDNEREMINTEKTNIFNYSEEALTMNYANQIREEAHFRIVKDDNICGAKRTGQYLIYNKEKGKYDLTDSDGVKGFIRDCIHEHPFSRKLIENVFYNLITASDNSPYMIDVSQINNDEGIINFTNGIYDIATRTMLPHDPKYISTIQIPCSYTTSVTPACPDILKDFLLYCFDNDKAQIKLLFQFFGVAISNLDASSLKKALFIVGPGNTGKSLLRNLICELVGKEKCGTSDLSQLEQRFGTSILYQKRIGGYSDMSADFINQVELFKNLTGGDDIPVEFKHQNRFSMRFKGLLLFTANKLPQFPSDTGEEVFDRMCIMKTVGIAYDKDKKPSPSSVEKDPAMLYKLLQDDVKRFFIYRAIQGLHEVINDHQYSITAKNDAYMKEYRESLNSVKSFLKNCCILAKDSPVKIDQFKTKIIYDVYCNWCGSVGLGDRILKNSVFNSELSRLGCGMSHFSNGYDCYTQFTLNQETRTNYHICPLTKSMF